ncbi:ABC transporter permease subunit [Evansella sp. AB-P1]|uniref:ABC transporter permease subunit n=1 Tax=Evansella sp. AB-P1 TaxID=3037653 RepID=UPI00241C9B6C|nr:ABC transporter permease subunit [Evansella sp. AB-P1]MDG5789647.1 ABC transporter permease subunit [Evansella sp. AB-P1]
MNNKITNQIIILIVYFLLFLSIISIVLLPRGVVFTAYDYHVERSFSINWTIYWENIRFFFASLIEGDFGVNIYDQPVINDVVIYFFQRSLPVIIGAFLLAIILGVVIGTIQFSLRERKIGKITTAFSWVLQSLPDFFIYIMIQIVLFQLFRWGLPSFSVYGYEAWHNYLMGMIIVSLFPGAYLSMLIKSALDDELNKDYINTAKSKGITSFLILMKHQWMNIIQRIAHHIHTIMIMIIGNLLIFEYLFFMRGAAMRTYQALGFHDATIRGSYRSMVADHQFEPPVIIWLLTCFLLLSLLTHVFQSIVIHYLNRRQG